MGQLAARGVIAAVALVAGCGTDDSPRWLSARFSQGAFIFPDGGGESAEVYFDVDFVDGDAGSESDAGSGCVLSTASGKPSPLTARAGVLTISSPPGQLSLSPQATQGGTYGGIALLDTSPWVNGPLVLSGSGGDDVPSFSSTLPKPRYGRLTAPTLDPSFAGYLLGDGGLDVEWTGVANDERLDAAFSWGDASAFTTLRCAAPATDGRLFVPASSFSAAPDVVDAAFRRHRQTTLEAGSTTVVFSADTSLSAPSGDISSAPLRVR